MNSHGQVTIPAEIRKDLELKEGDKFHFRVEGNFIILKKNQKPKALLHKKKTLRKKVE